MAGANTSVGLRHLAGQTVLLALCLRLKKNSAQSTVLDSVRIMIDYFKSLIVKERATQGQGNMGSTAHGYADTPRWACSKHNRRWHTHTTTWRVPHIGSTLRLHDGHGLNPIITRTRQQHGIAGPLCANTLSQIWTHFHAISRLRWSVLCIAADKRKIERVFLLLPALQPVCCTSDSSESSRKANCKGADEANVTASSWRWWCWWRRSNYFLNVTPTASECSRRMNVGGAACQ